MIRNKKDLEDYRIVEKTKYGITANNGLIKRDDLLKAVLNKYCADPELELIIKEIYPSSGNYYCMNCGEDRCSITCRCCKDKMCRNDYCKCNPSIKSQCYQCNRICHIEKCDINKYFCMFCDNFICYGCESSFKVVCESCSRIYRCKKCNSFYCKKDICNKCNKPICNKNYVDFNEKKYCDICMKKYLE